MEYVPVHDVVLVKHVEKMMIVRVKHVIHSPRHVQALDCKPMNRVVSTWIVNRMCVLLDSLLAHAGPCVAVLEGPPLLAAPFRRVFVPTTFLQERPVQPMILMGIDSVKVVPVLILAFVRSSNYCKC